MGIGKTRYKILRIESFMNLEMEVCNYIDDGWQPIGGVSISKQALTFGASNEYCQAITKVEGLGS